MFFWLLLILNEKEVLFHKASWFCQLICFYLIIETIAKNPHIVF
jgi:hypothetical protein